MKSYLLPEDVRNALLSYLMGRPYSEVARGVQMLEGLREAPEPAPDDKPALKMVGPSPHGPEFEKGAP